MSFDGVRKAEKSAKREKQNENERERYVFG